MVLSREALAFDAWLTTQPESIDDGEEHHPDCECSQCENERALDEDADAFFDFDYDD